MTLSDAKNLLNTVFGYSDFRLNQADIVQTLLEQRDVLALMPTGGGKSLCYQIPAIIRPGVGVVVSPLIALMHDQVDALHAVGIKAAYINSSLSNDAVRETEQRLRSGELDLLYVAPERLLTAPFLALLEQLQISLFAIDEAHCVSQWGHDFRPDYQQLSLINERFPGVPKIALTATADSRTQSEIISQLSLSNAAKFINSFDRSNITYTISESNNSRDQLWQFIEKNHAKDAGIVYCLSRKKVEATAKWLSDKGREALPYHAGLDAATREQNQRRFLQGDGVIIVATIAFGMGIDKPDVRFVAHLSLPKSIEAYYQETGRAGRDGEPANAWMAYGLQDVITLRQMMQQSQALEQYKMVSQQKLEAMLGLCEAISCRRQILLRYFDEHLEKNCGNCDNCLNPPLTWDATKAAQQALSCVYRSGQRFGIGYVIDILIGKDDERILNNSHNEISTFGIGKERSIAEWRSLFRQLIAQGFLFVDHERFGAVSLTEKSRPVLRSEQTLLARKISKVEHKAKRKKSAVSSIHQPLMDGLKSLRKELAEQQGLPPYVIFHDATLIEMVDKRPTTERELQFISGVGTKKLTMYGAEFIKVIKQFPLPENINPHLSDTVNESLLLLDENLTVEQIAQKRSLTESTIYEHMSQAIAAGMFDPMDILPIDQDDYYLIRQAADTIDVDSKGRMRQIKEMLGDDFDYGVIQCVMAAE
jgi:ATP-dependent DNA helicase RecQ